MRKLLIVLAVTAALAPSAFATPLPEEDLGEMAIGRERLAAVSVPEIRQRFPALVARAEASFDCWTLNPEARAPEGSFALCRGEFMVSIHELERLMRHAARQDLAALQ